MADSPNKKRKLSPEEKLERVRKQLGSHNKASKTAESPGRRTLNSRDAAPAPAPTVSAPAPTVSDPAPQFATAMAVGVGGVASGNVKGKKNDDSDDEDDDEDSDENKADVEDSDEDRGEPDDDVRGSSSSGVRKYKPLNEGHEELYNELGYLRADSWPNSGIVLDDRGVPTTEVRRISREEWKIETNQNPFKERHENLHVMWERALPSMYNRIKSRNFIVVGPWAKHITKKVKVQDKDSDEEE